MVMLDLDYDERAKIFDLDEVHYADAIEKEGWKLRFQMALDAVGYRPGRC